MPRSQQARNLSHFLATLLRVGVGLSWLVSSLFRSRAVLVAENLFLRKQLAFYQERKVKPRRLSDAARICLVIWSRLCNWREALVIVKPETLMAWHRKGFRLFWHWKSKGGRPRLPNNIRQLIAEMATENPTFEEFLRHRGDVVRADLKAVTPAERSALEHALERYLEVGGFPAAEYCPSAKAGKASCRRGHRASFGVGRED